MIYRDQLEAVYRLIEKPENWRKDWFYTRNDEGEECAWCLEGAVCRVLAVSPTSGEGLAVRRELDRALALPGGEGSSGDYSAGFNDTHTHAEVLELLRNAIERAPVRP